AIGARAKLAVAMLQVELGQLGRARALVDEVMASSAQSIPAVALRTELVRGLLLLEASELAEAEKRLEAAYFAARSRDDGEVMLYAVAGLVHSTGALRRDRELSSRWIANALADSDRERTRFPEGAAYARLMAAAAAQKLGDNDIALTRLGETEAMLDDHTRENLLGAVNLVRAEVLADMGRLDAALAFYDTQLALFRRDLGDNHSVVAQIEADRASLLIEAGRDQEAVDSLKAAMAIADSDEHSLGRALAGSEISIGATLLSVNDERAGKYLGRAREKLVAAFGENHPDVALIDTNLALLYADQGDLVRALAALRRAVHVQETVLGPDHLELGAGLFNLAVIERDSGSLGAARVTAARCAALYQRRQHGSPRHVSALALRAQLDNLARRPADALAHAEAAIALLRDGSDPNGAAWVKLEAARALLALHGDRDRIRRLLVESRSSYELAQLSERVREVDALLAALR
ncbi:MAG TPA: tetratricopeptide repeat protein, partial [Kofleriaceae bacterium]|nr:tetratricopeptide repeat protein [Kofleriaceae bacterium]